MLRLTAHMVIAFVLVIYPPSVSVASSIHGPERTHGYAETVADVSASAKERNTAKMPCPEMPGCNMFDGAGPRHMIDLEFNGGECCSGFCVLAMGLANAADLGSPIQSRKHFLSPQRVVLAGEWAAPLRPPNI